MTLTFKAIDQTLVPIPTNAVPRDGSRKYLFLEFDLNGIGEEFTVTAYLHKDEDDEGYAEIYEGNPLEVPPYFTQSSGFLLHLGFVSGDTSYTTNDVAVSLNAASKKWTSIPPSVDIPAYQQLVQKAEEARKAAEEAKEAAKIAADIAAGAGLPVAEGDSGNLAGVNYEAYGDDLPELELGRQMVLVPLDTNTREEIFLAVNNGPEYPIRLRNAEAEKGGYGTKAVPVGAFIQNIPYTLTFAGDCWFVDSIAGVDLPSGFINAMKNIQDEDICGIPLLDNTESDPRYILMHIVRSLAEEGDYILTVPSTARLDELLDAVYKRIDGINVTGADGLFIYFGKTIPEDAPAGSILIDLSGQFGEGVSKEQLEAIVDEALKDGVDAIVEEAVQDAVKDITPEQIGALPNTTVIPVVPDALPNPFALTFEGAVQGRYDGSKAVTVNIPMGGGSKKEWVCLMNTTFTEDVRTFEVSKDIDGNNFSLAELFMRFCILKPAGSAQIEIKFGSDSLIASDFFSTRDKCYGLIDVYKKANNWVLDNSASHATILGTVVRHFGSIPIENAQTITNFTVTTTSSNSLFTTGSTVEIWGLKS